MIPLLHKIIILGIVVVVLSTGFFATIIQAGVRSETFIDLERRITVLEKCVECPIKREQLELAEIAQKEGEKSHDEILITAVAKIVPAVVSIVGVIKDGKRKRVRAATGFFITEDGYIATNRHVVDDEQVHYKVILSDGSRVPAKVIYKDSEIDFALLKIEGTDYISAQLGNSDGLKIGQSVFVIGNALGRYSNSVSGGIISGLGRDLVASGESGSKEILGAIQTDAAINRGNSGGPLVDLQGKVVGVNVAMVAGANNIGFSIPINIVKDIIQAALN